jgi:hypothetical protein
VFLKITDQKSATHASDRSDRRSSLARGTLPPVPGRTPSIKSLVAAWKRLMPATIKFTPEAIVATPNAAAITAEEKLPEA